MKESGLPNLLCLYFLVRSIVTMSKPTRSWPYARAISILLLIGNLIGVPRCIYATNPDLDSLLRTSLEYFKQAVAINDDFRTKRELASQAAAGFELLKEDSLLLEARFEMARASYYLRDSVTFVSEIQPLMEAYLAGEDTSAIVRAYNLQGAFYFSQGNVEKGTEMMETPDKLNYYSPNSLEENVFNLGALVDIGLGYMMNMDTVSYYVNRLQQLASMYENPSVQVVSRFKLAQLFNKALNFEASLQLLRAAYPYLRDLENKGFSHFYYRSLINSFINLGMPDSARHYIDILQEVVNYPPGDPRGCYAIVSKVRADMELNQLSGLPVEFEVCYDLLTSKLGDRKKADINTLSTIYAKSKFLLLQEEWRELAKVLELLIECSETAKSNQFLAYAYQVKYESLAAQGQIELALEAHITFKNYSDKINQLVFSQSETLVRNQYNLQLMQEENKVLQVENQNQKLRLTKERSVLLLFLAGLLLLGLLVTYFFRLSYLRAQQGKELSRLIKERTEQLERANLELTQTNGELLESNTELERFAFIASHDLKTPLHNIIKFSGLLKHKLEPQATDEIKDYLSFIIQGGKRMNFLIEDVLEYSKLSRPDNGSQKEIIDLNRLVGDIARSISEYLDSRNASIAMTTSLPSVFWCHSKIFMLFKNLIENGVKYNESPEPTISIRASEENGELNLFFSDNGIGIGKEYHEKIFLMFTRLHNQTEYEGSGLGLAACKKIVEEFGGTIHCEEHTQGTSGTTFRISLPQDILTTDKVAANKI